MNCVGNFKTVKSGKEKRVVPGLGSTVSTRSSAAAKQRQRQGRHGDPTTATGHAAAASVSGWRVGTAPRSGPVRARPQRVHTGERAGRRVCSAVVAY